MFSRDYTVPPGIDVLTERVEEENESELSLMMPTQRPAKIVCTRILRARARLDEAWCKFENGQQSGKKAVEVKSLVVEKDHVASFAKLVDLLALQGPSC